MTSLTPNALVTLQRRYLKDAETPEDLFRRVADNIAENEPSNLRTFWADVFYEMMDRLEFLPNSPTLMNAGRDLQQLSACFVLPIDDSLESIFKTLSNAAIIHKSGGGTGFDFSNIRSAGSMVQSTRGVASGPVSFLRVYNAATEAVKQGGTRRGANMAILNADHPDILEFIDAKRDGSITNFNLSVSVTDAFMQDAIDGMGPADGLFERLCESAWETGDPGLVFIDQINLMNWNSHLGRITATNPCGEQPLMPYEACTLGSVNLMAMLKPDGEFDWTKYRRTIRTSVRFLDNVLSMSKFPIREITEMVHATRRIGLGVMGFADLVDHREYVYGDINSIDLADCLARDLRETSELASQELGHERGAYPASLEQFKAFRNTMPTTIAPTGTISMIAGVSSGIEPAFASDYTKTVLNGAVLPYTGRGKTALELTPTEHVDMQAIWQRYVHNGVSKTVNMPNNATVEDVKQAYFRAWERSCKGITVFRDGCKTGVLSTAPAGVCPTCSGPLIYQEGCASCPACGTQLCS